VVEEGGGDGFAHWIPRAATRRQGLGVRGCNGNARNIQQQKPKT
jgi:hypothetical protein